jgi:membrane protein DedA with SNARE-associated domain
MIEILALIYLARKNGSIAEKKGHKPGRYKLLTVLLWLGGEVGGAFLGAMMAGGTEEMGLIYLLALLGALVGALLSRLIVNKLTALSPVPIEVFD